MKVLTGPNAPLQSAADQPHLPRRFAWIVGAAMALFALGAFAAALIV